GVDGVPVVERALHLTRGRVVDLHHAGKGGRGKALPIRREREIRTAPASPREPIQLGERGLTPVVEEPHFSVKGAGREGVPVRRGRERGDAAGVSGNVKETVEALRAVEVNAAVFGAVGQVLPVRGKGDAAGGTDRLVERPAGRQVPDAPARV